LRRNGHFGVNELTLNQPAAIGHNFHNGNLYNPIRPKVNAGCFKVNKGKWPLQFNVHNGKNKEALLFPAIF
jgi:hypothetical protein